MSSLGPALAQLNAILNTLSACCLVAGLLAIRRDKVLWHRRCMMTALSLSVFF